MFDISGWFAVCLTVVVVGLGLVASPATAVDHADEGDVELTDGGTYFIGQELYTDRFDSGDSVQLRRGEGGNDRGFVTQVQVFADGDLLLQTDRRTADTYYLTDGQGTTVPFDLAEQSYSVDPSRQTVTNGTNSSVSITVGSSRSGYTQELRSPQLDASELETLLGVNGTVEPDGETLSIPGSVKQSLSANFSGLAPGTYRIQFNVPDTTAQGSVTVSVVGSTRGSVSFATPTKVIRTDVGTVAEVPLRFDNAKNATLRMGSDALGWNVAMTVTDVDGDGSVTIHVNTSNIRQEGEVFTAGGGGSVAGVSVKTGSKFDSPDQRIAAGTYPMSVETGGRETDIGTLSLTGPASRVCNRDTDGMIAEYENNVDLVPGLLSGTIGDTTIHGIVNNDQGRDYSITTGTDKRISGFEQGVPEAPSIEVETDCKTVGRVIDAEKPVDAFGTAYDDGDIRVRGVGPINAILIELLKFGIKIGNGLGLV